MELLKRPGNVVDVIYDTLRERIINGIYPPGLKMSQNSLAKDLNVSRTPLREALNRLQADRLVISNSNRGMEVAAVMPEETEQWYALRLMVEPPLIAGICAEFSDVDYSTMRAALTDMERSRHRTQDYQAAHLRFHEVALRRYPDVIREMIESIYKQITRHQRAYFSRPRVSDDFIDVDSLYLNALSNGDALLAKRLLEFHLVDAALGLLLDVDQDYVPTVLLTAARGLGIEFEVMKNGMVTRPAKIYWKTADMPQLPELRTINLEFIPIKS
jgi:DNA-binding GntR family transcriptional regulator